MTNLTPVQLPAGTTKTTHNRVANLIWAYLRLGGKPIESDDVRRKLTSYLADNDLNSSYNSYVQAWKLVREAEWSNYIMSDTGARCVMFELKPGYNYHAFLEQHFDPPIKVEPNRQAPPMGNSTVVGNVPMKTVVLTSPDPDDLELPMPDPEPENVYMLPELTTLFLKWSQKNPQAYVDYVDRLIPVLKAKVK